MNLSNLNHLKNLSWYTTVPLLVCAWLLQDQVSTTSDISSLWSLTLVVGIYFMKVVGGLFAAYIIWLFASVHLDSDGLPLTILLATFLLTLAAVGFGIYILKPTGMSLPVNIIWFAAFGSVAFNLYQIQNSVAVEDAKNT